MAVIPHTIDVVVADMDRSLAFYRTLGLAAPATAEGPQVEITTPGGTTIGLVSEAMVRQTNPHWVEPIGQRITFSCRCDTPAEVDATYAAVTAAGYEGRQQPWDAFWGQRYAMLADPDGNRVDLFADLDA